MDPELSPNLNLLPGTSGPEETPQEKQTSEKKPQTRRRKVKEDSESGVEVVDRVEESAKEKISPADLKLAIRMNKHIMGVLGLNKRSRSFRV